MSEKKPGRLRARILVAVAAILAFAIGAVYLLLRTQMRQREFSVLQAVRLVVKAAANYHAKFGTYPPALEDLAIYEEGWSECYATEPVFTGKYYGYSFDYKAPLSPTAVRDRFFIVAVPFAPENRGAPQFCADQTGTIRAAKTGQPCTINSDEVRSFAFLRAAEYSLVR